MKFVLTFPLLLVTLLDVVTSYDYYGGNDDSKSQSSLYDYGSLGDQLKDTGEKNGEPVQDFSDYIYGKNVRTRLVAKIETLTKRRKLTNRQTARSTNRRTHRQTDR